MTLQTTQTFKDVLMGAARATSLLGAIAILGTAFTPLAHAVYFERLSPADQQKIQKGQQVVITRDVPGNPWPLIILAHRIDQVTPEETAANTFDFEANSSTGSIESIKIGEWLNSVTALVDYVVKVPVLGKERFRLEQKMVYSKATDHYEVRSRLVSADRMKRSDSLTSYEPLGTGTFMYVESLNDPGVAGAGLFKGRAITEARETQAGYVKYIRALKLSGDPELQKQILVLRDALDKAPPETKRTQRPKKTKKRRPARQQP